MSLQRPNPSGPSLGALLSAVLSVLLSLIAPLDEPSDPEENSSLDGFKLAVAVDGRGRCGPPENGKRVNLTGH